MGTNKSYNRVINWIKPFFFPKRLWSASAGTCFLDTFDGKTYIINLSLLFNVVTSCNVLIKP